jgi:hypothetical protein
LCKFLSMSCALLGETRSRKRKCSDALKCHVACWRLGSMGFGATTPWKRIAKTEKRMENEINRMMMERLTLCMPPGQILSGKCFGEASWGEQHPPTSLFNIPKLMHQKSVRMLQILTSQQRTPSAIQVK